MTTATRQSARRAKACATLSAPRCVIDAVASGHSVVIRKRGSSFYVQRGDVPLARRGSRKAAQAAIDTARELAKKSTCLPCESGLVGTAAERRLTRLVTPQRREGEPAHYAIISADDLIPSHDPLTFQPDPRYPAGVQERVYHSDKNEKDKVASGGQRLDPSLIIVRTPTAVDGPPIVTEDLRVLGGNGRSMMVKRAYAENGPPAARYRTALRAQAPEFGFTAADVDALARPVLVRVVDGFTSSSPRAELAGAVRRYNENLTNAIDARAKAVALSRQLSDGTVKALGELLLERGDSSLRDVMRDEPEAFLRVLEADGVITATKRSEWATAGGALTDEAKDQIEGMFLGRVLGTADRVSATSPALLRKLERAVPHLVAVVGANPSFDLIPTVQQAVDLLNDAGRRGLILEDLLAQSSLFAGARRSESAIDVARLLNALGQRAVGERFTAWSRLASFDPRQQSMFDTPPTLEEALTVLTEAPKPRTANPGGLTEKQRQRAESAVYRAAAKSDRLSRDSKRYVKVGSSLTLLDELAEAALLELAEKAGWKRPSGSRGAAVTGFVEKAACGCREKNPANDLRMTVARDNEGRSHPALVRMGPQGIKEYLAAGEATKTSHEAAVTQARTLAKRLGVHLEVDGVVELPSKRAKNPGSPRMVPVIRSKASSIEALAAELARKHPDLAKLPVVLLQLDGVEELLRLELDGGKVRRASVGRKNRPDLRTKFAQALKRALA